MKDLWKQAILYVQECHMTWLFGVLALLLLLAGTVFLFVMPEHALGCLSSGIFSAAIWLAAVTS